MSELEAKEFFNKIETGIREAQRRLYERKAKLGETVIVADSNGMPMEISGEEALSRFYKSMNLWSLTLQNQRAV